jgi:hypothetical protein
MSFCFGCLSCEKSSQANTPNEPVVYTISSPRIQENFFRVPIS